MVRAARLAGVAIIAIAAPLTVQVVPGNHRTSLGEAATRFRAAVEATLADR